MFARLAFLFVVVPLVELILLIQVGQVIGVLPTIAIVLTTGIGGAALARREGLRTLSAIQTELAAGRIPGRALTDGAAILFGGALLLTPGILTDLFGLSLLLPVTRGWFRRRLRSWFDRQIAAGRVHWTVAGPGLGSMGGRTEDGHTGEEGDGFPMELDPRNEIDGGSGAP